MVLDNNGFVDFFGGNGLPVSYIELLFSSSSLSFTLLLLILDYFPIRLHKTCDLPPDRPYIFGYHPHGVIALGWLW